MDLIVCNKPTAVRTSEALGRLVNLGNSMKATAVLQALDSAWKVLGGGIFHYLRITFVIDW